ncbi:hypothetical protein ILFOPFJJ_01719 [Ensifer psoraleae]|nr:hypothetical protein [Sinorhizobium psoraleae]
MSFEPLPPRVNGHSHLACLVALVVRERLHQYSAAHLIRRAKLAVAL